MNVLPSAPAYDQQLYPMQELTQLNAEDFRLKKINDLLKELSDEVEHKWQRSTKGATPWYTPQRLALAHSQLGSPLGPWVQP